MVRQRRVAAWVLMAPLLVFAAVFIVYPLVKGIQTSFLGLTLQDPSSPWVGFKNYVQLFTTPGFLRAARFTLLFAILVTAVETALGIGLALLVNRRFPGKRLLFSFLLLPIMIAPALLGIMFRLVLNGSIGLVPAILAKFGLSVSLFAPNSIVPLLVVLDVLQWTSFTFLVVYAGLQSFPTEVLEAAQVDCAGRWRMLVSVILPIMSPVIAAAAFLRFIDAIRTFDVIYVLTAGGPGTMTTTLSIFVYKTAFISGNFGLASAASAVILIVLMPFVPFVVRRIARPEGGRP